MNAAILAGGRARRLGGLTKSALTIGGVTILDRQLEVLRPLADRILLVAAPGVPAVSRRDVEIVSDLLPGTGALGAIYTALMASSSDRVLVVAGDLPFLTAPFLARLIASPAGQDVVMPRSADGHQPLCAVYARRAAGTMRRRLEAGALKVQDLVGELSLHEIGPDEIAADDPDGTLFFNVNTPRDYERANNLAVTRGQAAPRTPPGFPA